MGQANLCSSSYLWQAFVISMSLSLPPSPGTNRDQHSWRNPTGNRLLLSQNPEMASLLLRAALKSSAAARFLGGYGGAAVRRLYGTGGR